MNAALTAPNRLDRIDPTQRTAILYIADDAAFTTLALRSIGRLFGQFYRQIVLLSVGVLDNLVVDAADFKGAEVAERLQASALSVAEAHVRTAQELGLHAIPCLAIGTDPATEIEKLCGEIARTCPDAMFFLGKVVLPRWRWIDRFLFSDRAQAIQRRLEKSGIPHVVLPFPLR